MAFTPAPPTPDRADKLTFPSRMYNWFTWFVATIAELSTLGSAYNLATSGTSSTSNNVTTGAKTFTVAAGLGLLPGMPLNIARTSAAATTSMFGYVTAYSGTTLSFNATSVIGSGTGITDWTFSLAATQSGASLGANIFTALQRWFAGSNIASAATVDLTAANGNTINITGTVATSAFTMTAGQWMRLIAPAGWPLTFNATTCNITGGGNYTCSANDRVDVFKATDGNVYVNPVKQDGTPVASQSSKISSITATVATNALTATIKAPFSADFRSSTLNSGVPNSRTLAADASVVAPSGATFGAPAVVMVSSATASASTTLTLNAGPSSPVQVGDTLFISGVQSAKVVSFGTYVGGTGTGTVILDTAVTVSAAAVVFCHPTRLLLLAIDNGGTIEAALVNQAGGLSLDETGLISTTAISASSTSNNVIYSTTARSNVPYKVVGFIDVVEAANGVYAVAPVLVQGATASAMAAMFSAGNGQTWQNVASQRVFSQNYVNTTGRPITLYVVGSSGANVTVTVNGVALGTAFTVFWSGIIPAGATYSAAASGAVGQWLELR